jgi:hypothetical protein
MEDYYFWDDINVGIQIFLLFLQTYVTYKEMTKFLKIRNVSQLMVLIFNYLHIVKLVSDTFLLTKF